MSNIYDKTLKSHPTTEWGGKTYPSLVEVTHAINIILRFAPETNGESAYQAYLSHEKKVGLPLRDLDEGQRDATVTYEDLQRQPRRLLNSPCWSGIMTKEGELNSIMLNYLTPHGKWHIHSTYYDNHRMLTLSRGIEPFWLSVDDAAQIGVVDNDWVEVYNDHGVVVTRSVVSARIPNGICIWYHSPERTISIPKSPLRGNRRAGGHNSLTRARLKPVLMMGGYGQFSFHLNYWGPTGVNLDTHVMVRKLQGEPVF
ncbi:MAG: molybdopterin dinucleotide binding domain-containing protein [Candidatus Marithrix sp.]